MKKRLEIKQRVFTFPVIRHDVREKLVRRSTGASSISSVVCPDWKPARPRVLSHLRSTPIEDVAFIFAGLEVAEIKGRD
jgi:hypothetical protein